MTPTRRSLMSGALVATFAAVSKPFVVFAEAARPRTKIWVGGTPGEMDWLPVEAATRSEALARLLVAQADVAGPVGPSELQLERAEGLDGLEPDEIRHAHWAKAGYHAAFDQVRGGMRAAFRRACRGLRTRLR